MAILTRSLTLLLVAVITVSQVEANIISDVLSWVGLGGSDKSEEGEVVAETEEPATEDSDLADEASSNLEGEHEGEAENSEEGSEEAEEESEEETNDGRAEEL